MIRELSSSLSTFKTLRFSSGLNILLAERHESSGSKDTRNGTGKTSFVELIHFLVSERRNQSDDFHKPELVGHEYIVTFSQEGVNLTVARRAGATQDEVRRDGEVVAPHDLRADLAQRWFGLGKEVMDEKFSPKFSALLSYFVRKERIGGFVSPVLNSSSMQSWDSQICLSYLLGFDWRLPQQLQLKKEQKKDTDTLAGMVKSGYFTNGSFDLNKMQGRLDLLDQEISVKRRDLASATVVDGYRQHEVVANELTAKVRDLNEANLQDLDLRESIDLALAEVDDARAVDVQELYNQVQIYFSDQIKKRFDQVAAFHAQVSRNREAHLRRERQGADDRLAARNEEIKRLQVVLKDKLALLRSGMAIERLMLLQSELNRLEREQADLQQQIPKLRDVEGDRKRLKREIGDLVDLIGQDVLEREEPRKFAVQTFAETSQFLYDEPGQLILGRSSGVGGLIIETDIIGKKSGGKSHMQLFCFDWLLVEASIKNSKFPGFLIHDSHIFDGVDGRQIGLALELAHQKCEALGVQYIVAMNSDDLQKIEVSSEFDPLQFVMETKLTDEVNGGLFGVRF